MARTKTQHYARFYWASDDAFEVAQIRKKMHLSKLKVYERQRHPTCWIQARGHPLPVTSVTESHGWTGAMALTVQPTGPLETKS